MTLDEAIEHCKEVERIKKQAGAEAELQGCYRYALKCERCASEHRQLAEWLRELKKYKAPSVHPDKDLIHLQKEQAYMQGYEDGRKPRTGKWIIYLTFDDCYYAKCDQCHESQVFYYNKPLTNFCPNCGADMRSKEEHTMEEFMYGQDMGNPEDGSL